MIPRPASPSSIPRYSFRLFRRAPAVAGATLLLCLAIAGRPASAGPGDRSPDGVWREASPSEVPDGAGPSPADQVQNYRVFEFEESAFFNVTRRAPDEFSEPAARSEILLALPMPDGGFERFRIVESPILSPELQAEMPGAASFSAQGLDNPRASGRFDLNGNGFHALILLPDDAVFIQPFRYGEKRFYVSFRNSDTVREPGDFSCGPLDELKNIEIPVPAAPPSGAQLRTYRLGISATGEYSQFFGGVAGAQAQIMTTITGLNAIYEREVSIRFMLTCISAYPDPTMDPFPTPETAQDGTLNQQNQDNLDDNNVCGSAAYDVGQVFHKRASGYRGQALGDACTSDKGKGDMTGVDPTSPIFLIDGLAHEMGHQFSAAHSYNGSDAGCSQRSASSAYEIGSGSTIMSYAIAGCTEDIPGSADNYFHTHSFDQITDWREGGGNCGAASATGNTPPNVSAGSDYTIPRGTPFTLTASGNDPDGDPLTFCWEQYDLGDATPPFNPDNGPLFRSRPPVAGVSRTFPQLVDVVNGTPTPFEILPTVDRTLHFRVTARDGRAGGGGVNRDDMTLTISGEPFRVTSPNGGEVLGSGCGVTVTWDVGGGDVAMNVNILLTTSGTNFNTVLAANTPNDGSEEVMIPCTPTLDARIMVQAAGNVFFDVSDGDFEIESVAPDVSVSGVGGAVDGQCERTVTFSGTATDDCAVNAADVEVLVSLETANATLGVPVVNKQQVDPTTVSVTGSVLVSDLTGGPATIRIRISAEDGCGATGVDESNPVVFDDTPPDITCPADITIECSTANGTPKDDPQLVPFFGGVSAVDNCDPDPAIMNDAPDFFDLGETVVKFTATDASTNSSDCTAKVTVVDTTPPTIEVTLDRYSLWPPNHKLSTIVATVVVEDICDPNPTFVLTSITSNEPANGTGDGDTPNDIQADFNTADTEFQLRSERSGAGAGRKYTIIYTASDMSGNTASDTACVTVPHDKAGTAMAGAGFTADGRRLAGTPEWCLVIPSGPALDAMLIEAGSVRIGNHLGTLAPVASRRADANGDKLPDLVVSFESGPALDLLAAVDGGTTYPVGLRYENGDGEGYWLPDILDLGAPVGDATSGVGDGGSAELLNQASPNPFRGSTRFVYALASTSRVLIDVYNVAGQPIRRLVDAVETEGRHTAAWDGRDESGAPSANGIYFIRGIAGGSPVSVRVTLLR